MKDYFSLSTNTLLIVECGNISTTNNPGDNRS